MVAGAITAFAFAAAAAAPLQTTAADRLLDVGEW